MSEFSDKPFCVKGGEIIGNVPTIEELAVYIKDYIKNDVYSSEWGTDDINGATRKALYGIIQKVDILPVGTILMYDGAGINNVQFRTEQIGDDIEDTISMSGWFVCNGLVTTPNLFLRFVMGNIDSGSEGGSNDAVVVEHIHTASQSQHSHIITGYTGSTGGLLEIVKDKGATSTTVPTDSKTPSVTVNNAGVSGIGKNIPRYYSVIYIIKMS